MSSAMTHDPLRAALEFREQLASDKRRLAFFLGAGISMAVGVPGIDGLTRKVADSLLDPLKSQFALVRSRLQGRANVEDVLNRIRLCRELLEGSKDGQQDGLTGVDAKKLDAAICGEIYKIMRADPPQGMKPHVTFAQWLHALHASRECPVEIFTTNYDLLLERAMEEVGLPFFDGFIGSVAPFFAPESVEADGTKGSDTGYPPRAWTRLWKVHGSIGWHLTKEAVGGKTRITRLTDRAPKPGEELMIFPSREKYADSRKLPFLTYQDRLRRLISSGEALLVVAGYSFSDEHLNEILFQGLRANGRLAITVLTYGLPGTAGGAGDRKTPDDMLAYGERYRNLTVYGPDKACIGGMLGDWTGPSRKRKDNEAWPFWDDARKQFTLGDFNALASYLEEFIGFSARIERGQGQVPEAALGTEGTRP